MRKPIPLLVLLLIAWLGFGAFFYNKICCAAAAGITSPLLIKDGSQTVASHASNLLFGLSGAKATIPANVKAEFGKVAAYLGKNPNKSLLLVGQYGSKEAYKGDFDNLGFARADDLKKYMVGLGVAGSQILTGSEVNDKLIVDNENVLDGIRYSFKSRSISISDAAAFSKGTEDNLLFPKSDFKYKTPLSDKLNEVYAGTAEYLKTHPDRSINLTGFYQAEEEYTGAFLNLGLARANSVKDIFIGLGVAAKQIATDGKVSTSLQFANEELVGGMDYTFFETPKADDRLPRVEKMLKANPLILYFKTNESNLSLSATQKQYFADLIYYLDNKPGAKVNSTGFTDDRGVLKENMRLGRKRAEFVRDYLSSNGIAAGKINTVSRGPDNPIDSNETKAGQAKNRRVEVSINK